MENRGRTSCVSAARGFVAGHLRRLGVSSEAPAAPWAPRIPGALWLRLLHRSPQWRLQLWRTQCRSAIACVRTSTFPVCRVADNTCDCGRPAAPLCSIGQRKGHINLSRHTHPLGVCSLGRHHRRAREPFTKMSRRMRASSSTPAGPPTQAARRALSSAARLPRCA